MADIKFSQFTSETEPADTDEVVGFPTIGGDNIRIPIGKLKRTVQLDSTVTPPAYSAYNIWPDVANKCVTYDTGFSDVRCCIGFESYIPVYNNTGSTILNGTPLMGLGTYVGGVPSVTEADADNPASGLGFFGVATHDIAHGSIGASTYFGAVNGVDTSSLSQAPVFVASGGGLTNDPPLYPATRILVGGATVIDASNGVIGVNPVVVPRNHLLAPSSFTSQGITSGSFYKNGFYDFATTSVTLTNASTTQTYGTVGRTRAAHAAIVPSGPGTVDTGQVGLRVTGTLDSETGPQLAAQTQVITDNITTLTANQYYETVGKFSGQITFELYVVSGSPTTYSLSFNYGYAKYDDFGNIDFTITGLEFIWRGAAADSGFNIQVYKHSNTGWTYSAGAFVPGNGIIAERLVDQAIAPDVANGKTGAWKRVDLNEYINGSGSEGFLVKITTTANNTIQTMDGRIYGYSEELF